MFQPLDHFCGPSLHILQQVYVSSVLRTLHTDAVLLVRSHQQRRKGQDHLPCPAGHASFDAAQDMVGFLVWEGTLLALSGFLPFLKMGVMLPFFQLLREALFLI